MTGATDPGPGGDAGNGDQQAALAETSLSERDITLITEGGRLVTRAAELTQGLGELASERRALKTGHQAAVAALETEFQAGIGAIDQRETDLTKQKAELEREQAEAEAKVQRLGGRLRAKADKEDALRGDVLAYAAFATGDPTPEGIQKVGELDDLVKAQGGQPFVIVQGQYFAFGKIRPGNDGLQVDTKPAAKGSKEYDAARTDRVHLPIQTYLGSAGSDEGGPAFGWVSQAFDGYHATYDSVLRRDREDSEVIDPASMESLARFGIDRGHLRIAHPARLEVMTGLPEIKDGELKLYDDVSRVFTGELAIEFFHQFVDTRLAKIEREMTDSKSKNPVAAEFARISAIAQKLGIPIDYDKIPQLGKALQL